jgi:hypothetical protein
LVQTISLKGLDPYAGPFNAHAPANGIEQCKFNPRNNTFYLAIPGTGVPPTPPATTPVGDGYVLQISQPVMSSPTHVTTLAKVLNAFHIDPRTTGCGLSGSGGGPAGLSIGPNSKPPNGYIVLGCGKLGTGSLDIGDSGTFVARVGSTTTSQGPWYRRNLV